MDILLQDLRFAVSSLRRTPGFALTVLVVLALGIGVNVMIFTMVYGVMFRPWPLPESERVVAISQIDPRQSGAEMPSSWQNLRDLQEQSRSLQHLGAYWVDAFDVAIGKDPEQLRAACITSEVFPALGVAPALGRGFRRDEEVRGRNETQVIISDRVWRERFAADPRVIGRSLRVDGKSREIVGVMGPGFHYPTTQDLWIPAGYDAAVDRREHHGLFLVGRLGPGVRVAQAEAELRGIFARLAKQYPDAIVNETAVVRTVRNQASRGIRSIMLLMIVAVLLVLLIASANVANLMFARATARRREISLRMALGAPRERILRQLLTESLVLSSLGAALGLALAAWGNRLWTGAIAGDMPFYLAFRMDAPVLVSTALLAVLAAVTFGLAPAWYATDTRLMEPLREGSMQSGASRSSGRLRSALVVGEVAFSLVLLVGSGLMLQSFLGLERAGAALRTPGVLTAQVSLSEERFPDEASRRVFLQELSERVRATAGVTEFSVVNRLPLGQGAGKVRALADGTPGSAGADAPVMNHLPVLPGYFDLIGLPVQHGRDFNEGDRDGSEPVVLVSRSAANELWPGQDPLGHRVRFHGEPDSSPGRRVVGVVPDIAQEERGDNSTLSSVYLSQWQAPSQRFVILVRSSQSSDATAAALRAAVAQVHPDLALTDVRTLREALRFQLGMRRMFSTLMFVFGAMALLIAALGLYGVMAYSVAQRTQEFGIRMALGAEQGQVIRMVVFEALRLVALGCAIGWAAALALTQGMASVLTGVRPTEPLTYAAVSLLLVLSGALAALVPALRATRVDPMVVLKGS